MMVDAPGKWAARMAEDIGAEATLRLMAYGDLRPRRWLYVPTAPSERLVDIVGARSAARLCEAHGRTSLRLPGLRRCVQHYSLRRARGVAATAMLLAGVEPGVVCAQLGYSRAALYEVRGRRTAVAVDAIGALLGADERWRRALVMLAIAQALEPDYAPRPGHQLAELGDACAQVLPPMLTAAIVAEHLGLQKGGSLLGGASSAGARPRGKVAVTGADGPFRFAAAAGPAEPPGPPEASGAE